MNRSRASVVASLLVIVAWALVLAVLFGWGIVSCASWAVGAPTVETVTRSDSTPLRVTTYNVRKGRSPVALRRELGKLATRSDVILAQEAQRVRSAPPGWRRWAGPSSLTRGRPILWRVSRFVYRGAGARLAQRRPFHRLTTFVRLQDRQSGRLVTFVNYHGVPHVERAGHPRRNARVPSYAAAMRRLGALVVAAPGPLVVAGDWNVNRWADKRVRWRGFPAAWLDRHPRLRSADRFRSRGTLGNRTVDYAFSRTLVAVRLQVGPPMGSDHRPVTVDYRWPSR